MTNLQNTQPFYEMDLAMTGMTEYGTSFDAVMDGAIAPPAEGAQFDVAFEGAVTGPKLNGKVVGVDYMSLRADGRTDLNVRIKIITDDGHHIAAKMNGNAVVRADSSIIDFRENGRLLTSTEEYKWVNNLQVWASGTVDRSTGQVKLTAYVS